MEDTKYKDRNERKREIVEIMQKLSDFGLTYQYEGIKKFNKHAILFVNEGLGWSGSIKIKGTKRILIASLSPLIRCESAITLKYDETV